jgi:hypothetical protein
VLVVEVEPDLRRLRSRSSSVLDPVYSTEILSELGGKYVAGVAP